MSLDLDRDNLDHRGQAMTTSGETLRGPGPQSVLAHARFPWPAIAAGEARCAV